MALTTGQIAPLLVPGLRDIKAKYKTRDAQYKRIFSVGKSSLATEKTVHTRLLGLPSLKDQGKGVTFDNEAGYRFTYNHVHQTIAQGYSITEEAMDDNLYKAQFDPSNLEMVDGFLQFREILAANVFNNGNIYNPAIGGDGVPLFSTAHPVDGNTIANTTTVPLGLNEAAYDMASNQIRGFRNYANLLISARARKLLVPVALRRVAMRLQKTDKRPGTADNDINAMHEGGDFDEPYEVNDYLTSPYAWGVLSDKPGLICLERKQFEISMQVDFVTNNLLVKGVERYYIGYDDWRCAWFTFPLS
jgi:phage major head subunit gpT-like protein